MKAYRFMPLVALAMAAPAFAADDPVPAAAPPSGATLVPAAAPKAPSRDELVLLPEYDVRLREENVDQASLAREANAVTARLRIGVQAKYKDFTALVEAEGLLAIDAHYNNTNNGLTQYPGVSDPQNIELNRLQLQYNGIRGTQVTVGRQRIALDDERFISPQGWRQNEQTFDAVRLVTSPVANLKFDLTYVWSVRTIYGIDGIGARPQSIPGNNGFFNLSYKTPVGTLVGFAYLIDQDTPLLYTKSSQTYGVRFAGNRPIAGKVTAAYQASYARQSDWHRNPNRFTSSYYMADLNFDFGGPQLGGRYEVLGADKGAALTSFQTPLASLFKVQGWADQFLATPPNGVRDKQVTAGYLWKKAGPFTALLAQVSYHWFDSDRLGIHYGNELDANLSAKFGRYSIIARYAKYDADRFSTDVRKFWLSFGWSFGPAD